jgi:Glycosyltransferase (GlcNAc)
MKIFVSICSYRDPQLRYTLESLIENQSQLTKVTYGIFEQTCYEDSLQAQYPDLINKPNIRYKRIDPEFSDGVGWARHINSLQVDDEEFYYQVDSHMLFDKNWDRYLINDFKLGMQTHGTDKIIINANCGCYDIDEFGNPTKFPHGAMTCKAGYWSFHDNYILGAHGELVPATEDLKPSIHLFAGNFFTHTDWLRNVGINPNLFFEGEEQVMTLSSFAAGYKLLHPKQIYCYHLQETNHYISKQHFNQVVPQEQMDRNKAKSRKEFTKFLDSLSDEFFEEYRKYSGVDYINRKLEQRAIAKSMILPPDVVNDWEIPNRTD